jgi:hypothetical protein
MAIDTSHVLGASGGGEVAPPPQLLRQIGPGEYVTVQSGNVSDAVKRAQSTPATPSKMARMDTDATTSREYKLLTTCRPTALRLLLVIDGIVGYNVLQVRTAVVQDRRRGTPLVSTTSSPARHHRHRLPHPPQPSPSRQQGRREMAKQPRQRVGQEEVLRFA